LIAFLAIQLGYRLIPCQFFVECLMIVSLKEEKAAIFFNSLPHYTLTNTTFEITHVILRTEALTKQD
jgi:hypothetical protein